jgi:putative membrane protein
MIIGILVSAVAVFVTAYVLPGVDVTGFTAALVVAVVLGVINTFIKPLVSILALPITVITLGLFSLVINALMVLLVDAIVPGFTVNGFIWALAFALVLSIVNGFLNALTK